MTEIDTRVDAALITAREHGATFPADEFECCVQEIINAADAVDPLRKPGLLHIPEDGLAAKIATELHSYRFGDYYQQLISRGEAREFATEIVYALRSLSEETGR